MSIYSRIDSQVRAMEVTLWRCRIDKPATLLDIVTPGCVLISPVDGGMVTAHTRPSLSQKLKQETQSTFLSYEMHDIEVIEVGMMAATIVYRVTATRASGEPYAAFCSSAWKQGADAEWKLCVHQESPF